jgi:hypothetical protein
MGVKLPRVLWPERTIILASSTTGKGKSPVDG